MKLETFNKIRNIANAFLRNWFGLELCTIFYNEQWIGVGIRTMIADSDNDPEGYKALLR